MKYRIYRTSDNEEENKPCNHTQIRIEEIDNKWYIYIDNIEDLYILMREVGRLIIQHNPNIIEIYDDYRE